MDEKVVEEVEEIINHPIEQNSPTMVPPKKPVKAPPGMLESPRKKKRKKRRERKERRIARSAKLASESLIPDAIVEGFAKPPIEEKPPPEIPPPPLAIPRRFLFWKLSPKEPDYQYILIWKLWKRKSKPEAPNAYVSDFKNGLDFESIAPELIPADSRIRRYKGYQVHMLSRDKDGLHAVEPPKVIGANESPREVYTALNCPEVEVVFGIPDTLWNKVSHIALYVLMGVDLIMVFLIWGSSM